MAFTFFISIIREIQMEDLKKKKKNRNLVAFKNVITLVINYFLKMSLSDHTFKIIDI